jgi:rhamnosyltransferase
MSQLSMTDVVAVVTSFNPGDSLVDVCSRVLGQVAGVIVVDDGSTDAHSVLERCRALGCRILKLGTNAGIAAALNAGIAEVPSSASFVLTIDQDSQIGTGYVDELLAAMEQAVSNGIAVAMVAPESVQGLPARIRTTRNGILIGDEPIQSGLLISRNAIARLGPFLESLFIDGVDTEYFLRARSKGLETVVAPGSRIEHSLGNTHFLKWFGRRLRIRGQEFGFVRSASFRYYYLTRNHVVLLRRYARSQPRWAIRETLLDLRHFAVLLVFVPDRWRHFRLLVLGVRDGVRGVGGKLPSQASRLAAARPDRLRLVDMGLGKFWRELS